MNNLIAQFLTFMATLAVVIAFSALMAYPFMLLWNTFLVKAIPGIHEVEWMQMWGIAILTQGLVRSNK